MVLTARMGGMARVVALLATVRAADTVRVADTVRATDRVVDTPLVTDPAEWPVTVALQAAPQVGMLALFDGCTTTSMMGSITEWPREQLHAATAVRAEAPEFSIRRAMVRPVVLREVVILAVGHQVVVRLVAATCNLTATDHQVADRTATCIVADRPAVIHPPIRAARQVRFISMDRMTA
jgi:hypothetical protein